MSKEVLAGVRKSGLEWTIVEVNLYVVRLSSGWAGP
jgi:hypothetical protein